MSVELTKKKFIDEHRNLPDDAKIGIYLFLDKIGYVCHVTGVYYHPSNEIQIEIKLSNEAIQRLCEP
jgi:hypothetical protein